METILNQKKICVILLTLTLHQIINIFIGVPVLISLSLFSCLTVYVGSFMASKITIKDNVQKRHIGTPDEEVVSEKDVMMVLVYGSCTLYGLYTLYKYLPKELMNFVFTIHFSILGLFCLAQLIEIPLRQMVPGNYFTNIIINKQFEIKIPMVTKIYNPQIKYSQGEALAVLIAVPNTLIYVFTKHWLSNNVFGVAFSIVGIENFSIPTFKIAAMLLWVLFFYDIFWVYGTDVMVTVAKSLDAPIKLLFPYDYTQDPFKQSMLGLGDIIIPGAFVALALKYDVDQILKKSKNKIENIYTPYFNYCFVGYIIGIFTTYTVMVVFEAPQPALFFLVPGVTFALLLKAWQNKDIDNLLNYDERELKKPKSIE